VTFYIHEIPSLVALIFKLILLGYAARSPVKNSLTRVFLVLLALLSVLNVVELTGINYHARHGFVPAIEFFAFAYIALLILVIPAFLHISLRLSFDAANDARWTRYFVLLYLPALPLEYLLLYTDQLIAGFEPFKYSIIRVPGSLYFLFETYAVVYLLATFVNLCYGARASRPNRIGRTRNRFWLVGLSPFVLMFVYLFIAGHFGWPKFTTTFHIPNAITFFLVVTTYAIHNHRLFDIEFFIPGTKLRKRKTAFYGRIQALIGEFAELRSVREAIARLAETLQCPAAVIGARKGVIAASTSGQLVTFPDAALRNIDRILVAHEIADRLPDTYAAMRQHKVAAIVPFHAASESAAGWLLLGEPFSERVYTARDFQLVEKLFDKLGEFMLDDLALLRRQLSDALHDNRTLGRRVQELESEMAKLRKDNAALHNERSRWLDAKTRDVGAGVERHAQRNITASDDAMPSNLTLDGYLSRVEARLIEDTLRQCRGNKSEAARLLGLRPNTLHYKMARYGIVVDPDA